MRKRVDVQAEEAARESGGGKSPTAERTVPLPMGGAKVSDAPELPIERDLSAMCIELQKRGYGLVRLTNVSDWAPQVRHIVAMWLVGQLSEGDVPEAIKVFKGEKKDESPRDDPPAKREDRKRGSDLVQTEEGPKTRMQEDADRDQAAYYAKQDPGGPQFRVEYVEVTWGEERYAPVSYQSFGVGPFSARIACKPGESPEAALERGYAMLESFARKARERKLAEYVEDIARQRKKLGALNSEGRS